MDSVIFYVGFWKCVCVNSEMQSSKGWEPSSLPAVRLELARDELTRKRGDNWLLGIDNRLLEIENWLVGAETLLRGVEN